jgi:hypothetical protein
MAVATTITIAALAFNQKVKVRTISKDEDATVTTTVEGEAGGEAVVQLTENMTIEITLTRDQDAEA